MVAWWWHTRKEGGNRFGMPITVVVSFMSCATIPLSAFPVRLHSTYHDTAVIKSCFSFAVSFAYVSIVVCPQTFALQCIAISQFLVVLSAAAFVIAASVCPDSHGASEPRRRALLGHA